MKRRYSSLNAWTKWHDKIATESGHERQVEGEVETGCHGLMIHKDIARTVHGKPMWTVTHRPSGMAILRARNKAYARWILQRLCEHARGCEIDWAAPGGEVIGSECLKAVAFSVREEAKGKGMLGLGRGRLRSLSGLGRTVDYTKIRPYEPMVLKGLGAKMKLWPLSGTSTGKRKAGSTMKTFHVTFKGGKTIKVKAGTHQQAADKAARKRCGKKAFANRQTGVPSGSGWFRSFKPYKGGGSTSCGPDFHVFE